MAATRVYLEVARRRAFAMALDWPGWGRSGRTPEAALETLAAYAPRYARVVARVRGVRLPASAGDRLEVVEELPGDATTEFGAPDAIATGDALPWQQAEATLAAKLLSACWAELDDVAAAAPAELRKGPRGGGRDRDKVLDHVLGAEVAYARKLGVKMRQPAFDDADAIAAEREELLAVVRTPSDGAPPRPNGWPVRYAVRRIAWHVLDHAWEIEDRAEPAGDSAG